MGFSRQEYFSELPFPPPKDLPDPGIEPGSPALSANALTSDPPGKPTRTTWEAGYEGDGINNELQCRNNLNLVVGCILEKEMATHSSVLAWRIPGTGGAWWAAGYGVTQSRIRLKWLSSSSSRTYLHPKLFPLWNSLHIACKYEEKGESIENEW